MASRAGFSLFALAVAVAGFAGVNSQAAQITKSPVDVTVKLGEPALLECEVQGDVGQNAFQWQEFQTNPTGAAIYKNPPGQMYGSRPRYAIQGTYNLRISKTEFSDGGLYACSVFTDENSRQANLVVLDTPRISIASLVDGKQVTVTCSADYAAPDGVSQDHIPEMHLRIGDNFPISGGQEVRTPRGDYVTLSKSFNYTARNDHHDEELLCSMSTVTPQYSVMGRHKLNIQFAVTDIDYAPKDDMLYVGEKLNCTARGSPRPTFKWEAVTSPGPYTQSSSELIIKENMVGENRWKCVATNTVTQTEYDEIVVDFTVEEAPGPTGNPLTPAGGVKAWVIAVAVIVPVLIVCAFIVLGILF